MILSLLVILSEVTFAQKAILRDYKIRGAVIDNKGIPVPFANVLLYNSPDSVTTKGTTSDEDGNFEIPATPGNYYLKISFLSYHTKTISDIKIINSGIVLG